MAIPKNIKENDIRRAINEIRKKPIPDDRQSDRYFVLYSNETYPPKYVISIANQFANGSELDYHVFNTYQAQDFLRRLGFTIIDIEEKNLRNHNGFKLVCLDIRDNKLLGTNYYDFLDYNDIETKIYTTVIIGTNGTGKSNLFRVIISLFRELYNLKKEGHRTYEVDGQFSLKYSIDNKLYDYTNFKNPRKIKSADFEEQGLQSYVLENGSLINYDRVQLPEAIIANSIMLTDKFPLLKEKDFSIYKYLGVRSTPQQASTRSYVRRTVEFIVENLSSGPFKNGVNRVAKFLTGASTIDVTFFTNNTAKFFKGNLSIEAFKNYFENIEQQYSESNKIPPFKLNYYRQIKDDNEQIKSLVGFCNNLKHSHRLGDISNSSKKFVNFNIAENSELQLLKDDFSSLNSLRELGIVTSPEITIGSKNKYNLQESSSGEYHFFSSMIGLLATVKSNCLVFIDEPEISLHPNWQMQYISFLRQLFANSEFAKSHILLATHSHFLISDLEGECSKIIGLKRTDGELKTVEFSKSLNTYGWSAEEVLYEIFNVRSSRNSFLEYDLTKVVSMVNKSSTDFNEIGRILNKVKSLVLNEADPLKIIIEKVEKYISDNNA